MIGKGILRIQPKDMQQQARTMQVTNARTPEERLATLARFGDFFLGELYDVYGGITRRQAYFNPDAPPRKKRPLRVGAPEVHTFMTEDSLQPAPDPLSGWDERPGDAGAWLRRVEPRLLD